MADSTPTRQRFDAAVHFIANYQPTGGGAPVAFDDSVKLSFYGLYKSATEGPCRKPRPGLFDLVGRAKIDAWASNGEKTREQAMVDYVLLLDRLHPHWRSWDGIPEALREAVRPSPPAYDAQTPRMPGSADRGERSNTTSGIYGDFTSATSASRAAGGVAGRVEESPSLAVGGSVPGWALGSPLPPHLETPVGRQQAPSTVGPRLSASAIEGSGGRTTLARSSSSSVEAGGTASSAAADPAGAPPSSSSAAAAARMPPHTAIRWSLSPNLPLPPPPPPEFAAAASPASPRPLATSKLAEMCGLLERRVEAQRAALADAHAALAATEGELAALQAAYVGAAEAEAQGAEPPRGAVAAAPLAAAAAPPPRRRGLLGLLWGWAARLLRRGARYPLATAVLALFLVLLALRLRRGRGARQLLAAA